MFKGFHRLWLGCVIAGWMAGADAAGAFTVKTIKQGDLTFPVVTGGTQKAAERINAVAFVEVLRPELPALPPQDPAKAFSALPKKDADMIDPMPSLDFEVLRNDANVLSFAFNGEGCGAYCEPFQLPLAFDSNSGRLLTASDLFSAEGRKKLFEEIGKRNQNTIRRHIAKLKGSAKDFDSAEDQAIAIGVFEECLERWRPDSQFDDRVGEMELRSKELVFINGRCSNHATMALDDLGDFRNGFSYADLQAWMSAYGRRVLLGEKTNALPSAVFGQWLRGTVGGKTNITLYLEKPYKLPGEQASDVSGYYFYDRYRKPLPLRGQSKNGQLALDEYGPNDGDKAQAKLVLTSDGSGGLRGHWQSLDGKKSLDMVLAP